MKKRFIIGVFGPPGSGKSTVSKLLAEHGYKVWNADDAVNDLYQPNKEGSKRVAEYFGKSYVGRSGGVLKNKLGKMAMGNSGKFRILEYLIHPLVINSAQQWIDEQKKVGTDKMALEAAVFDNGGLGRFPDLLLRVTATKDKCMERIMAQGKPVEYFKLLYGNARDYETSYEIANNGSFEDLKKAFEKALAQITIAAEKKLS